MTRAISDLPNLGPYMAEQLAAVGVRTADELEELGAVAAFVRLRRGGTRVSLNALYAMEAALQGVHWLALDADRKRELKAAVAFDGSEL